MPLYKLYAGLEDTPAEAALELPPLPMVLRARTATPEFRLYRPRYSQPEVFCCCSDLPPLDVLRMLLDRGIDTRGIEATECSVWPTNTDYRLQTKVKS